MVEKEFVPVEESVGKSFQMDNFGNFRIVVKGKESEWVGYERIATLKIEDEQFIGVSEYYKGYLPTECTLRVEVVDEDGDSNFLKCKIISIEDKRILDHDDVEDIIREPGFDAEDYGYLVKESSQKDFVKIRITQFGNYAEQDRFFTKEEIIEYLTGAFPPEEFEVYDEDNNIINVRIDDGKVDG